MEHFTVFLWINPIEGLSGPQTSSSSSQPLWKIWHHPAFPCIIINLSHMCSPCTWSWGNFMLTTKPNTDDFFHSEIKVDSIKKHTGICFFCLCCGFFFFCMDHCEEGRALSFSGNTLTLSLYGAPRDTVDSQRLRQTALMQSSADLCVTLYAVRAHIPLGKGVEACTFPNEFKLCINYWTPSFSVYCSPYVKLLRRWSCTLIYSPFAASHKQCPRAWAGTAPALGPGSVMAWVWARDVGEWRGMTSVEPGLWQEVDYHAGMVTLSLRPP